MSLLETDKDLSIKEYTFDNFLNIDDEYKQSYVGNILAIIKFEHNHVFDINLHIEWIKLLLNDDIGVECYINEYFTINNEVDKLCNLIEYSKKYFHYDELILENKEYYINYACEKGNMYIFSYLYNSDSKYKKNYLNIAIIGGNLDTVKYLHSQNGNAYKEIESLKIASMNNRFEIVKWLFSIDNNIFQNCINKKELLINIKNFEIVEFILLN